MSAGCVDSQLIANKVAISTLNGDNVTMFCSLFLPPPIKNYVNAGLVKGLLSAARLNPKTRS